MDDSSRKPRWWLIITAAVLAVLTLYYYTGSWLIVALFFAAFGVFVAYQKARTGKPSSHACLRCGAKLNPNARECRSCGSASWTRLGE
jgi:ribosomal protein L40E